MSSLLQIQVTNQGLFVFCDNPENIAIANQWGNPMRSISSSPIAVQIPKIGDRMPDGTIYAGLSASTNTAMFAAAQDSQSTSLDAIFLRVKAEQAQSVKFSGYSLSHQQSADLLEDVTRDDGGWRIPTAAELDQLCRAQNQIGGFAPVSHNRYYWSSTVRGAEKAVLQNFSSSEQVDHHRIWKGGLVRFIRTLPRERAA